MTNALLCLRGFPCCVAGGTVVPVRAESFAAWLSRVRVCYYPELMPDELLDLVTAAALRRAAELCCDGLGDS